MLVRSMTLALSVTSAAGFSQFPEFSQQYTQRLGGAVDALTQVVAEFDADAASVGRTRAQALADLAAGGEIAKARSVTMERTIKRQEKLSADQEALASAGPFTRAYYAWRMTDRDVARKALMDYKPALPLTFEGVVFAALGFFLSLGLISLVLGLFQREGRHRAY